MLLSVGMDKPGPARRPALTWGLSMGQQFSMGVETLSTLSRQTDSRQQSLGSLVRELAAAADPLQHKFTGEGAAVFVQFHAHSEEIARNLDRALASVLEGIQGQDRAYVQGDQAIADDTRAALGSSFDSGRFGPR
jgi:uncharacterized protein YukE